MSNTHWVMKLCIIVSVATCGGRSYNPTFYKCCGVVIISKTGILTCCGGVVTFRTISVGNFKLRGGCCGGVVLTKGHSCCGSRTYNPTSHMCCRGVVRSKTGGSACCGTGTYNPTFYVCCDGAVNRKSRGRTACCGIRNYNPTFYKCCKTGGIREKGSAC